MSDLDINTENEYVTNVNLVDKDTQLNMNSINILISHPSNCQKAVILDNW